ncbi:MAG: methyltransferase domain-containing protein [Provencibacterium sp.]|nr:methyltransferase domain-containing protein [Provencibacterium sp.]
MRSLTVYDLWPGLSPMQRGALCAAGLMAGFHVRFAWSDGPFFLKAEGLAVETGFSLRLHHLLHRDGLQPQADEKWLHILYALYRRLTASGAEEKEEALSPEEFKNRLEKIRRLTLSLPLKEDDFLLRFKTCYGEWGSFQIRGKRPVNPVNQREAGTYKEIFARSAGGVASIDHAMRTLLRLLPGDAHRILDVGSGPGYVNRCLPPDRAVLAMDIDPDILKENRCLTCVGDILDIPLEQGAVDLCMACDVLEHIEPEQLPRAMAELCRVSGRYLYLQVPYWEQLPASFARCPQCGHLWHVNFHKNAFSLRQLLSLPGEGWEPLAAGFTGELSYQGEQAQENRLLEALGLQACRVEGWNCPVCGAQSTSYLQEPFNSLHAACSAFPQTEAAPRYSEIAVLFCKKGMAPAERSRRLLACLGEKGEAATAGQTGLLQFSADMLVSSVYTGSELLPFALCGNCRFDWENGGRILKEKREQPAFVSAAFPLRPAAGDTLRIRGNTAEENRLTLCMLDAAGQEALLREISLRPGDFDETLTVDYRFSASRAFLKIYFEREGLSLYSAGFADECGSSYRLYQVKGEHLTLFQKGIAFFWYTEPEKPVHMLPRPRQWLAAAEGDRNPPPALLPDYIGSLRGIIREQRREYEKIGAKQAGEAARFSRQLEAVQGELREALEKGHSLQEQNGQLEQRLELSEARGNALRQQLEESCSLLQLSRGQLLEKSQKLQELEGLLKLADAREIQLRGQLEEKAAAVLLLESVRCRLWLQLGEQAAALELTQQRLSVLQLELTQTKQRLALCGTTAAPRPRRRLALRAGAAAALRRMCRFSIRVVHKIPYLYPLLVRLGVKKAYNRLKLKMKSGESYE